MSIVLETRANQAKPEAQNEHIPPDRLEQQIRETEIPRSSDGRFSTEPQNTSNQKPQ